MHVLQDSGCQKC